jgi:ribosomal protein S18 acetylase RimI-like enzyme
VTLPPDPNTGQTSGVVDVTLVRVGAERAATIASLWAVAEAHGTDAVLPQPITAAELAWIEKRLRYPRSVGLIAEFDGGAVACIYASPAEIAIGLVLEDVAHLSGLAVAPPMWGQGIASAVFARIELILGDEGYREMHLYVREDNARARRMYERRGWDLDSTGHEHASGPHALYTKLLGE